MTDAELGEIEARAQEALRRIGEATQRFAVEASSATEIRLLGDALDKERRHWERDVAVVAEVRRLKGLLKLCLECRSPCPSCNEKYSAEAWHAPDCELAAALL